ncbi:DUF4296 domain-containing protein [Filimonas effusa]|uniref:DUF4296 domain-containing protein n=1 Tax=Filimonas effusa TaxID=2508721 RepID=A0A4V1M9U0_9BACT|nr:DUF4296 domain-containing protein [Filimonas effusa]RXK82844.1 DUF4296 domain-containing protein [Filimonas effusa]
MIKPNLGFAYILSLVLLLMAGGCGNGNPGGILSPDKMQQVMWDMMRADELAMDASAHDTARNSIFKHAVEQYQQVFEVHHITREEFYRSIRYYQEHPDKNKVLMDSVQALGNRARDEQSRIDSILQVKLRIKDSIRLKQEEINLKKDSLAGKKDSLQKHDSVPVLPKVNNKEALRKEALKTADTTHLQRLKIKPGMDKGKLDKNSLRFTPAHKLR